MPAVDIRDVPIFYVRRLGGQQNLVLVHGAGGSHQIWLHQVNALRQVNVYALDLPGHGRSEGEERETIGEYGDLVIAFLDALGIETAVISGHSMGGAIALDLALRYPARMTGLVLVCTGARLRVTPLILDGIREDFQGAVDLIGQFAYGPNAPPEAVRLGQEQMARTPPDVLYHDFAACDAFDIRDRLAEIRCPTLVISATADRLTPLKYGVYLQEHIAGARLAVIEDAGHTVMLEHPRQVAQVIQNFLTDLVG
jgi:pimeloyl-ACP methyl ester carboxylesterase